MATGETECIRYRDQNYRQYKAPGYVASGRYCQVHHILPCTSVSDGTLSETLSEKQYELIQNCFQATHWDINNASNCIGLPLKKAYYFKVAPKGWNGWPCHVVDHPAYNKEVTVDLKTNIWDQVSIEAKKCKFDATGLQGFLNDRSDYWKERLKERGSRLKSTEYHWENRIKLKDTWFVPFSMADPPEPRSAPKNLSDELKKHLAKLFSVIGH
jgi:hypothetical protein